jgi:hypothetical protein
MNYCEFPYLHFGNRMPDDSVCDAPACTKIKGKWYCGKHAEMMEGSLNVTLTDAVAGNLLVGMYERQ